MGFYDERILPHILNLGMRQEALVDYRRRTLAAARGRVLEIGAGSGLNLPYYPAAATHLIGLDPSATLLAMARRATPGGGVQVEWLEGSAEAIPLEPQSVDTVVTTWTLCSIPDVSHALREVRRVLKPAGRLLFAEHGRSPDAQVRKWQDRLTPVWTRIAGGCHLNRPITQLIEDAGFHVEHVTTGYMKGPRPMTFMYEGRARTI